MHYCELMQNNETILHISGLLQCLLHTVISEMDTVLRNSWKRRPLICYETKCNYLSAKCN